MVNRIYIKLKHIHLVGIGGTGMSGIAEVLLNLGYKVSGSDLQENEATRRLARLGATISIGHHAANVEGADVVVISSAIKPGNVEVEEAKRLKIPVIPRAEMLAELMRLKLGIAVAGSHGKTTTTSMIAQVLEEAGLDPTIIVGGRLNTLGAHAKLGQGDFIVAEADESDRSFLYLSPFIAVLTNLDEEHLDQYKTLEEIKKTFISFANKVPFYCPVILCLDDANLQSLIPNLERRVITYGFSAQADIYAQNPSFAEFSSSSTVFWQGKKLGTLRLNVPGLHSIYNAMAAIAVGLDLDIPSQTILKGLAKFKGIGRRFELKAQIGKKYIFEDYAHHPTEIKATLEAAKLGWGRRILAVFQPHRYTRLALLMDQFSTCFNQADTLIITEIYPAGEKPIPGISGRKLFEAIQTYGHKDVYFEPEMAQIPNLVQRLAQPEDLIFVLGAGSIYRIIPEIIKKLGGKN
ncbi:MAG: UDP-N-acetylmuramate--L-alanine ligase [Candidatus Aminicenantes bacterium]|nr:MAG: UDP-N-acetylmuramate--L-alanine ligase [Candidatus Aminicenantes bacterium]